MYAPPIIWTRFFAFGNVLKSVARPRAAPAMAIASPRIIPVRKGNLFFMPNEAPLAARAIGAGPGEPSSSAVVEINAIVASNK